MPVHAARNDLHRVRRDGQRRDAGRCVLERLERISRRGAHVPQHDLRIKAACVSATVYAWLAGRTACQQAGVIAERDRVQLAKVPLQSPDRLPRGHVPQEDGTISAAGGKLGVVGGTDVSLVKRTASSGEGGTRR